MAVNRLEPDILTLHSSDGTKTLQIKVKGESLSVSVTDEIGLSTSTEIEGITSDQAATIGYALGYWASYRKLNFQDHEHRSDLYYYYYPQAE